MSLELSAAAHHLVQEEPSLAIEVEVARNIHTESIGSHSRRLHAALRSDGHPRELDRRVRRQDSYDGGRAPDGQALDRLATQVAFPTASNA